MWVQVMGYFKMTIEMANSKSEAERISVKFKGSQEKEGSEGTETVHSSKKEVGEHLWRLCELSFL